MDINREKYQEAILYFLHHCNNQHLGKTKLMKLLYYLDFDHYEQYGQPVTGDSYAKLPLGPVPQGAEDMLQMMEAEGEIASSPRRVYEYMQDRWIPKADVDEGVFSATELQVLRDVCRDWGSATRHEIVEATHDEEPWMAVNYGEAIPFEYAYYRQKFSGSEISC